VFYDNLFHMVFVRLQEFNQTWEECQTDKDKMLYIIRHAHQLDKPPAGLEEIFEEVFELAKISKFTPEELEQYEARMMSEMDRIAEVTDAREEGIAFGEARGRTEGIAEGLTLGSYRQAQKMAQWMLSKGMSIADIEEATGLDEPEILALE
jgi:predicted transposase/invertase (TIGR01784 family)